MNENEIEEATEDSIQLALIAVQVGAITGRTLLRELRAGFERIERRMEEMFVEQKAELDADIDLIAKKFDAIGTIIATQKQSIQDLTTALSNAGTSGGSNTSGDSSFDITAELQKLQDLNAHMDTVLGATDVSTIDNTVNNVVGTDTPSGPSDASADSGQDLTDPSAKQPFGGPPPFNANDTTPGVSTTVTTDPQTPSGTNVSEGTTNPVVLTPDVEGVSVPTPTPEQSPFQPSGDAGSDLTVDGTTTVPTDGEVTT